MSEYHESAANQLADIDQDIENSEAIKVMGSSLAWIK